MHSIYHYNIDYNDKLNNIIFGLPSSVVVKRTGVENELRSAWFPPATLAK